jgi:hypothetical protein
MSTERKYRMYGLVNYQLRGIQQGIQFGHAVVEYGLLYGETPEYQRWANQDKTFIVLNGGTTSTNPLSPGTLNQHASFLRMVVGEKKVALFYEPDLGDQLTAVVFLVEDRVWDKENWPDYEKIVSDYTKSGGGDHIPSYDSWVESFSSDPKESEKIVALRKFLSPLRLA